MQQERREFWLEAAGVCGLLLAVFALLWGALGVWTTHSRDLSRYQALTGELAQKGDLPVCRAMPELWELAPYEKVRFRYTHTHAFLFTSDAYVLRLRYDEETYAGKMAELEARYEFCTEPVDDSKIGPRSLNFTQDGFSFRAVESCGDWRMDYPRELIFVGSREETGELALVYFYDQELDYIEDWEAFFKKDCGWK